MRSQERLRSRVRLCPRLPCVIRAQHDQAKHAIIFHVRRRVRLIVELNAFLVAPFLQRPAFLRQLIELALGKAQRLDLVAVVHLVEIRLRS